MPTDEIKTMPLMEHLNELRMWIPLYLMYEVSIWVVRIFGQKAPPQAPAMA